MDFLGFGPGFAVVIAGADEILLGIGAEASGHHLVMFSRAGVEAVGKGFVEEQEASAVEGDWAGVDHDEILIGVDDLELSPGAATVFASFEDDVVASVIVAKEASLGEGEKGALLASGDGRNAEEGVVALAFLEDEGGSVEALGDGWDGLGEGRALEDESDGEKIEERPHGIT